MYVHENERMHCGGARERTHRPRRQRVLHLQAGWAVHMSTETWPGPHDAVSPGLHVIAHEAHGPTAGALHDAPVSAFFFAVDACAFFRG